MPKELVRPSIAGLLIAFLIAFAGPIEIILANIDELAYGLNFHTRWSLRVFSSLAGGFFLLFTVAFLLDKRFFRALELIAVTGIILLLLNKTLLYGDYGAFDGRGLRIDWFSWLSAVQIMVFAILIALFARKRGLLTPGLLMSALYASITLAIAYANFSMSGNNREKLNKHPFPVEKAYFQFSKSAPNYLYILLDEVYGGSAREIFESNASLAESFEGFTFFSDVAGIYPTTIVSVPSILNGSLYQNRQPVRDYIAESFANSRLFDELRQRHYPAYIHTSGMYCSYVDLEGCSNIGDMLPSQRAADLEYGKVVDIAVFKMLPELLKPYLYKQGNWAFTKFIARSESAQNSSVQVKEFRYFIDEINAAGTGPSFRLYHNTATHSPVKLDSDCDLLARNLEPRYENYLEQDKCGFSLVNQLLKKLMQLEVYDNTYIVISSDHGRPFVPEHYKSLFDDSPSGASYRQYGYAHATLLVKPLGARGNLQISTHPMSLLDVGQLLSASVDGAAVGIVPRPPENDRPFYYYNWSEKYIDWRQNFLPPFEAVYLIGPGISKPGSWRENAEQINSAMQRQIRQPLECGQKVSFADEQQAQRYASSGLSSIEKWGRWSDGSSTKLYFRGAATACRQQRIKLDLSAYLPKEKPSQHADIFFNGGWIGEVNFRRGGNKQKEISLAFDEDQYLSNEINTLEFRITDPVSPEQLDDGGDQRKLAIGFKTLRVE